MDRISFKLKGTFFMSIIKLQSAAVNLTFSLQFAEQIAAQQRLFKLIIRHILQTITNQKYANFDLVYLVRVLKTLLSMLNDEHQSCALVQILTSVLNERALASPVFSRSATDHAR